MVVLSREKMFKGSRLKEVRRPQDFSCRVIFKLIRQYVVYASMCKKPWCAKPWQCTLYKQTPPTKKATVHRLPSWQSEMVFYIQKMIKTVRFCWRQPTAREKTSKPEGKEVKVVFSISRASDWDNRWPPVSGFVNVQLVFIVLIFIRRWSRLG